MKKILIVDDHQLVGQGTKEMLEGEENLSVYYASSALKALEMDMIFDLYIIDIHMPDLSGIELSQELLTRNKDLKIILYTGLSEQKNLNLFTHVGISGVISKTATKSELINLVNAVLSGYTILPLSMFKKTQKSKITETHGLTEVDISILKYVSEGLSNKEIGEEVFLTARAVEYHLTKIYKKMDVKTRGEAAMEAVRLGLIDKL